MEPEFAISNHGARTAAGKADVWVPLATKRPNRDAIATGQIVSRM
jgi:hypothetical protein